MEFFGKATIVSSAFVRYQNPIEKNRERDTALLSTTDCLRKERRLELGEILNLVL